MKTQLSTILMSSVMATVALGGGVEPGSLVVFPFFDSTQGQATIVTVTNTNSDTSYDPAFGRQRGAIDIEYRYIDGITCAEFNRVETLTANDTLQVIVGTHNTSSQKGYLYVFAVRNGKPVSFNFLTGELRHFDMIRTTEFGTRPFTFKSLVALDQSTDLDNDRVLDLNGNEYEGVGDQLIFPHFAGQNGVFESELVLVNLTGGTKFNATADLLIYNDNEQVFSAELSFTCWMRELLWHINGAFDWDFLLSTNHNPRETVGATFLKDGWFRLNGGIASSTMVSVNDPAIIGIVIEHAGWRMDVAELPYQMGVQMNGDLLPRNVFGDNN